MCLTLAHFSPTVTMPPDFGPIRQGNGVVSCGGWRLARCLPCLAPAEFRRFEQPTGSLNRSGDGHVAYTISRGHVMDKWRAFWRAPFWQGQSWDGRRRRPAVCDLGSGSAFPLAARLITRRPPITAQHTTLIMRLRRRCTCSRRRCMSSHAPVLAQPAPAAVPQYYYPPATALPPPPPPRPSWAPRDYDP